MKQWAPIFILLLITALVLAAGCTESLPAQKNQSQAPVPPASPAPGQAPAKITPADLTDLVKEAVVFAKETGKEKAIAEFNDIIEFSNSFLLPGLLCKDNGLLHQVSQVSRRDLCGGLPGGRGSRGNGSLALVLLRRQGLRAAGSKDKCGDQEKNEDRCPLFHGRNLLVQNHKKILKQGEFPCDRCILKNSRMRSEFHGIVNDYSAAGGWISRRPRDVSLRTISLLDLPPSRHPLDKRPLTLDRMQLSLKPGYSVCTTCPI